MLCISVRRKRTSSTRVDSSRYINLGMRLPRHTCALSKWKDAVVLCLQIGQNHGIWILMVSRSILQMNGCHI
ncbi:hypothetical protein List180 [Vaccinia virus]|uniref:Uncharacterized protein n=1 Tax=Vaccinia virus (strain Lister) TaxID=10252 RepID=A4GDN7_VACCL|nr:hypothetical protein List180 [Vaccinia virus]